MQTDAKLRILIAEDDHDTANGLARLLTHMGFESRVCYTGLQCLACVEEFQPQIVLLDLGMPEIDGFKVAERIRESASASRPVLVALTGYGRQVDRERTARAGFALHLLKPALAGDIKTAIEQACRLLPG